jgi:hypothetical protein
VLWSPFSQGRDLHVVIVVTTLLASFVALSQLFLVNAVPYSPSLAQQMGITLAVKCVTTLATEWQLLPDVVVASLESASLGVEATVEEEPPSRASARVHEAGDDDHAQHVHHRQHAAVEGNVSNSNSVGMGIKYGALAACIDFGDQLGAMSVNPLVKWLDIQRDGNEDGGWRHLDRLVRLGALCTLMSAGFVALLPRERTGRLPSPTTSWR